MLDEMTASVGLPGVPFVVDVASRSGSLPTLPTLPAGYEVQQVTGEQEGCAALLTYHRCICNEPRGVKKPH